MKSWTFVILFSLLMAVLNSIAFFAGLFTQPAGTVYLGTVHYWEDYFFYLNHFFQGAHGAWMTVNRYTPEVTSPSIIYWCNVMLGKIGGLFFLNPILSYNISVLLLAFTALVFSYVVARKVFADNPHLALIAFLIGNTATSLLNRVKSNEGPMVWWPFQIWRTPHFAFDRLGGAPHQLVQTILAYLFFIFFFSGGRKSSIFSLASIVLLTTLNPIQAVFYVGIIWLVQLRRFKHNIVVTLAVGITALYINTILSGQPHVQSKLWEAAQHSYTTTGFLLLSLGPVVLLAIIGIRKKMTAMETFGALVILSGYALFFSKIPQTVGISNLRFLFPASYIFWGIFAARGIQKVSRTYLQYGLLIIFLLVTLPTVIWEINQKLPKPQDYIDPLVFMPTGIYDGFGFLSKQKDYDSIVLANPAKHMDTLVPALSGHTTWSGHMLTTVDNATKQAQATDFFGLKMDENAAQNFLAKNKINYILFTEYDGSKTLFENSYVFLNGRVSTSDFTVYTP